MRRITSLKSVGCFDIFFPYDHEYISFIIVYESLHLSCTNKCCVYPHYVGSNNIFHFPLNKVIFFLVKKEDCFSIIKIRTPQHYATYIKWYNIQIHFINQLWNNSKSDPTLFGDIKFLFITYPTKRIRLKMWFRFKTHLLEKCFRY